ncbi:MAG TPA: glycoside hydrolase family 16 protein [Verrucomicrobiae bacterium]|nr:glycoside hydrolase family 16 protein [Verrucomicrobiae bacterium]
MNKKFVVALGILCGLAMVAMPLRAANVLINPGFESDPAGENRSLVGWTWFGQSWGNTFNETGADARTGNNFFKVFQGFTNATNYNGIYQDYISGPGAAYTADGWAKTITADALAGQNAIWLEVTFRDANGNVLALYRSSIITAAAFPKNAWIDLPVTNQCNPNSTAITNTVKTLVAPAGTYFVRFQATLQGDPAGSNGSVYFDDLNLNLVSAAAYGDWNIVWSDEFNGPAIDTNTWTFDLGNGGWGNNELEFYTGRTNNAYTAGGLLHIVARKESTNGSSYTSARMKSQGLASWKYGRFEWRARFPAGTGFWPAIWFLGTNIDKVSWPGCGEIDVVESSGIALTNVQGSLHSGSDETAVYTLPNGGAASDFHTYVLDWATNSFLFYVDGHLYETQTGWSSSTGAAYPAPFDKPEFMLFNLAIGGNYVGNPDVNTINNNGGFPGELQVDYARVLSQTAPLKISMIHTNNGLLVSWPSNVVGHLQAQVNAAGAGISTNWSDMTQSSNPASISTTNKSGFFRVSSP